MRSRWASAGGCGAHDRAGRFPHAGSPELASQAREVPGLTSGGVAKSGHGAKCGAAEEDEERDADRHDDPRWRRDADRRCRCVGEREIRPGWASAGSAASGAAPHDTRVADPRARSIATGVDTRPEEGRRARVRSAGARRGAARRLALADRARRVCRHCVLLGCRSCRVEVYARVGCCRGRRQGQEVGKRQHQNGSHLD